ncbi:MAG TPA: hypothetical protein VK155_10460 [Bacteroidales bacterium]|jgi:hypothetical protein|nr:hypothetical protein [Bacteroidales bacterium]
MKKLGFIFILQAILLTVSGQKITVTAAFDSTRILIGDQIHYTITVEQPADLMLTLPSFRDTLIKNIEIVGAPETDSVNLGQGQLRVTEKYLITSFDSGMYRVPPVYAEVKNPGGLNRYYSDAAMLEVARYRIAPADSSAKIYDIVDPYRAPVTFGEILPWILLAIVLAGIVWFIIKWLRNRKASKTESERPVITEPAHIIAFRELEELKSKELWQKGGYKQYYTRLTEILRKYLENRYNVFSLELTTSETLDALLKTGFRKDAFFNMLKGVLLSADLVKFAKYVPGGEENELHFRSAWDFVEGTKVVIVQPEPGANKEEGGV